MKSDARGHLPPVQAEAPHPRDDRPRARPRAARDAHPRAAARGGPARRRRRVRRRGEGGPGREGGAGGRARHRGGGASRRTWRCAATCATSSENEGVVVCEAMPGKASEPTKFETYYGFRGDLRVDPVAPVPRHPAGRDRRGAARRRSRSRRTRSLAPRRRARAASCRRPRSPGSSRLAVDDALARLLCPSLETRGPHRAEARSPTARPSASSRRTCGSSSSSRRSGGRSSSGSTQGSAPAASASSSTTRGSCSSTRSSTSCRATARSRTRSRRSPSCSLRHRPFAIAVGNGTHGRETADFCRDVLKESKREAMVVMVSESGASVYSASDVAREEFPDLDLTVRGAVSIARRLQDPLAELVKVDPKAIGVGQYQHDVYQPLLKRKLDEVVESCVNAVGVELNTASAPLLDAGRRRGRVAREEDRDAPRGARRVQEPEGAAPAVPGLGPKAFEQCAGFVRVRGGANPLDASAVHPERYALVDTHREGGQPGRRVAHRQVATSCRGSRGRSTSRPRSGCPTLEDIQRELLKPGRDPREAFEPRRRSATTCARWRTSRWGWSSRGS